MAPEVRKNLRTAMDFLDNAYSAAPRKYLLSPDGKSLRKIRLGISGLLSKSALQELEKNK